MSEQSFFCWQCGKQNTYTAPLSFRAECSYCSNDLHVCKNCLFYDESAYNECRETSAERTINKEKNNLCEYFKTSTQQKNIQQNTKDLLKQAEALFKKNK